MDISIVHLDLLVQQTVVPVLVSTVFCLSEIVKQRGSYHTNFYSCIMCVWNISCPASMLEVSRLILESGWVPPRPVIFLFNGAEELFLLVCDC